MTHLIAIDRKRIAHCALFILLGFGSAVGFGTIRLSHAQSVQSVSVSDRSISVALEIPAGKAIQKLRLAALALYETFNKANNISVVWRGMSTENQISFSRFDKQKRDLLFCRFQLVDDTTGKPLGDAQYASDLSQMTRAKFHFPKPGGIKGLQCVVDLEDAIQLGVKHTAHNVSIPSVIGRAGVKSEYQQEIDGHLIPISRAYIDHLDHQISKLTAAGVTNTIIFLNYVPRKFDPQNPLLHPKTDFTETPNRLGAFNLTDARGVHYYRAALEFLAQRYSRKDKQFGLVSGYIIGNEIQAHWWWYNLGHAEPDVVIRSYARALRVAHLATAKFHPEIRTYVSMTHHWTARMVEDRRQFMTGREFLTKMNRLIQRHGNFPWHMAFHPYPEDLRNPKTWLDRQATDRLDTPKITFKNIEVLVAIMRTKTFLFRGTPRRIILSEQGFDTPATADGEKLQAAAFAYAFHRTRQLPGIDALILHRHVDHQHEQGLRLGLRYTKPGTIASAGKKKYLYNVFRDADSPQWKQAFEFAKPIIGITNWKQIEPKPIK